jgi:hypothetical protein
MSGSRECKVSSVDALLAALGDAQVRTITVTADVADVPSLRLSPGQALRGGEAIPTIRFRGGDDGVKLSSDNAVSRLRLVCDGDRRAVFNDTSVPHLGRLELSGLSVIGTVQILHERIGLCLVSPADGLIEINFLRGRRGSPT